MILNKSLQNFWGLFQLPQLFDMKWMKGYNTFSDVTIFIQIIVVWVPAPITQIPLPKTLPHDAR